MVDRAGAPAASGPVVICIGGCIVFLSCAAVVILSSISDWPPNRSKEVYGTETICTIMTKLLYGNTTSKYSNSLLQNSTAFSRAAEQQLEYLGVQNLAGCLLYYGRVWDAPNNSTTSRRRRRSGMSTSGGLYCIITAAIYKSLRCAKKGIGSTESNTRRNSCNGKAIREANSLTAGLSGAAFNSWASRSRLHLEATNTDGINQVLPIDQVIGINKNAAVSTAIINNLVGSEAYQTDLGIGCRITRILSQAQIRAILNSQVNSVGTDSSTASSG